MAFTRVKSRTSVPGPSASNPLGPTGRSPVRTLIAPSRTRLGGLSAQAPEQKKGASSLLALKAHLGEAPKAAELWRATTEALRGLLAEEVKPALLGLGFEPMLPSKDAAGGARFRYGSLELTVEAQSLGQEPALFVALEDHAAARKSRRVGEAHCVGPAVLSPATFAGIKARYEEDMAVFEAALAKAKGQTLPTDLAGLKALAALGQSTKKQKKEAARAAEVAQAQAQLTHRLEALAAKGAAPRGIIVYVEGPDGAGKSSTGAIVMKALEEAGYGPRGEVFKAPTEAERKQHWLKRFERGIPKQGEVVFWDRGPAGDAVYGKPSVGKRAVMAKELKSFERDLAEEGILLFKLELFASPEKQAETFGKRLARQAMAGHIRDTLAARGELDAKKRAGLEAIAGKIDGDDFRALEKYEEVQAGFLGFVEATEPNSWHVVDATKRHAARLEIIDRFGDALEQFEASAKSKAA